MKKSHKKKSSGVISNMYLGVIKSALAACVLTIILILLFALLLKWELLNENIIPLSTSIIKALCGCVAGLLCVTAEGKYQWIWGGLSGSIYIIIAFIAFTIVEKTIALSIAFAADILMGFIAGCVGVMLRKIKKPA